jgi:hypothetical protein
MKDYLVENHTNDGLLDPQTDDEDLKAFVEELGSEKHSDFDMLIDMLLESDEMRDLAEAIVKQDEIAAINVHCELDKLNISNCKEVLQRQLNCLGE